MKLDFRVSTQGLQTAVKGLSDWVVSLHPETEIVRHNLGTLE